MDAPPLRQDRLELSVADLDLTSLGLASGSGARLRPWRAGDVETLVAAWNDPDIARWNAVPPRPDDATAARWIAGVTERLARRLSVDWVIELDPADSPRHRDGRVGSVVGEVGLSGFSQRHGGAFIGYWLLPAARGMGVASVAVAAVIDYAHRTLGVDPVVARCHPANPASSAVARRTSCRLERSDGAGYDLWVSRRGLADPEPGVGK